jgi:HAD superfamily hydrolase (TIGR01458 family)
LKYLIDKNFQVAEMNVMTNISGVLCDLDGVFFVGSTLIDGAVETINELKRRGYICRFITNTSTLSVNSLHRKLTGLGLPIEPSELISAPQAALVFLKQCNDPVCYLVLADDVKKDFSSIKQSSQSANFVVIGDIGENWSYVLINQIFNLLMNGAKLVAIHKNRFWETEQGLKVDIGAFISGLEYASAKPALVIGKPSPEFFKSALMTMQLTPNQVAIIGDDIDSDIAGGQAAGLTSILVKTGKYRKSYAERSSVNADFLIDSIADLPKILE